VYKLYDNKPIEIQTTPRTPVAFGDTKVSVVPALAERDEKQFGRDRLIAAAALWTSVFALLVD
jgi:hypothetical protein